MKVIQVIYCFYPEAIGGAEIYVENLSRELKSQNVEVIICVPTYGISDTYFCRGFKVRTFSSGTEVADVSEMYDEGDPESAQEFGKIIDEEKPDMVHLHGFTRAMSLRLVWCVKKRGIPIVFTYNTPSDICQRGTLLRWGKQVCSKKLDSRWCSSCTLHGLGLPKPIAYCVGSLSAKINTLLQRKRINGKIWTALRMHGLVELRHKAFQMFMREIDHVTIYGNWVYPMLLRNNIPAKKITITRQIVKACENGNNISQRSLDTSNYVFKIVFMGRLNPHKNVEVLVRAVMRLSKIPIELHIYGIIQNDIEYRYSNKLRNLTKRKQNIVFHDPIVNDDIIPTLRCYHMLALPSSVVETKPFIVQEALSAGLPVMGADVAGINEQIQDGLNGIIVKKDTPQAWCDAIKKCHMNRKLLRKLNLGTKQIGKEKTATSDMVSVYNKIMQKKRTQKEKRTI